MDATSFVALSTALDISLPSALEDALQQLERTRMEREDLAARGIQGRFACNCNFVQDASGRYWVQDFHRASDMWLEAIRSHRVDLLEVHRVATTTRARADLAVTVAVDQMLEDLGSVGEETEGDDEDEDDEDAEMVDA